jgi:rhomboid protease GluP
MSTDQPPDDSPDASPPDVEARADGAGESPPAPAELPARTSFPCGRGSAIELSESGFRAPRWPGRSEAFVAYRDVTHIALEPRMLAIGTAHGVLLLSHARLGGARVAQELAHALQDRVFALPSGAARRARFQRLDARLRVRRPWIAALLVALTGVAYALQQLVPGFYDAAIYRPPLLALGEWWRYAATQFLHVNLVHLLVNAAATLVAGAFVERSLGRMGALFVAGAAGFGAMFASQFGAYSELLGFSGIAAGFFGALVAVEFFAPFEAPAPARIPRPLLLGAIALQVVLDLLPSALPAWASHTAGLAHLGGFLAGGAAALLVRPSTRGLVVTGALLSVLAAGASFAVIARNVAAPSRALERQARAMLDRGVFNPGELNNLAWQIATTKNPSQSALEAAVALAELAVKLTRGQEPTLLDTLAEVYFAQGRKEEAVRVIDEAIALAPGEDYYAEQRRRFTGERAAGDRPEAPAETRQARPREDGADGGEGSPESAPPQLELPPGDEITV